MSNVTLSVSSPAMCCRAAAAAAHAATTAAAAAVLPAAGAYPFKDEPLPTNKKLRNIILWMALCVAIVVPAVVG